MNLFIEYEQAFLSCYPQKKVAFERAKGSRWYIIIDGEKGEPLTESQMKSAIRDFRAGK